MRLKVEVGNAPGGALQLWKLWSRTEAVQGHLSGTERFLNMKNNIVIMNFSGVYEVQGLKAVLEAGKNKYHIISQLDCQDIPGD